MPTWNENLMLMEFEQLSDRLKTEEALRDELVGELADIGRQETAAQRIIAEIAKLGGHVGDGDRQQAEAKLRKFADQKAVLERRMEQSKGRLQGIRTALARFDQAELQRLGKIRGLFRELEAAAAGRRQPQP